MKALRVVLTQEVAHYKKEETIDNKMTYPLPPPSTVIGAIHSACNFKEYVSMKIGYVGKYGAMSKRVYTDNLYFNSVMDDRGILVKCPTNEILSNTYVVVAKSLRQGSSFKAKKDIEIVNEKLLDEYNGLKEKQENLKVEKSKELESVNNKLNTIKESKREALKGTPEYESLLTQESNLKLNKESIEEKYKEALINISLNLKQFNLLNTSIKSYEELYQVELIIYVYVEDEDLLNFLSEKLWRLKCIGRSEDMVDVKSIDIVELTQDTEDISLEYNYSSYIDISLIRNDDVVKKVIDGIDGGTVYYLNRDYVIENNKRKFNKVKVLHSSGFSVSEDNINGIYHDKYGDKNIIINLL